MRKLIIILITLISGTLSAQNISTVAEIYNFNIGDVFHFQWKLGSGPIRVYRIKILDKFYSPNLDSIFYVQSFNNVKHPAGPSDSTTYSNYVDTVSYTSLDSVIDKHVDSVFTDPMQFNGRKLNYYDTCIEGCGFEPHTLYYTYIEGCGLNFDNSYPSQNYESYIHLIYFKKGTEVWGYPDLTATEELPINSALIKIFPNPASDYFYIDFQSGKSSRYILNIRDIQGRLLKSIISNTEAQDKINVKDLKKGLYFVEIIHENEKFVTALSKY